MTTYASPTGDCRGGKSLGCSHTCVSGPTFPSVISAQKGHAAVPSRRFMRCGALTRYCLKIGFQIKGVFSCIYFLVQELFLMMVSAPAAKENTTALSCEGSQYFTFIDTTTSWA